MKSRINLETNEDVDEDVGHLNHPDEVDICQRIFVIIRFLSLQNIKSEGILY